MEITNSLYESDADRINNPGLVGAINNLLVALNKAKETALHVQGFTSLVGKSYDNYHVYKVGNKFIHLNAGGSGCFLIEIKTGEIFNIKAYGVPDYNKHAKCPLGTVHEHTIDASWLHSHRFNYIRDWKGQRK